MAIQTEQKTLTRHKDVETDALIKRIVFEGAKRAEIERRNRIKQAN